MNGSDDKLILIQLDEYTWVGNNLKIYVEGATLIVKWGTASHLRHFDTAELAMDAMWSLILNIQLVTQYRGIVSMRLPQDEKDGPK